MHSFLQLISTFSPDNHTRGAQFERLCKWLLENHPMYNSTLKKVWLWDDWPERWGKDCGIDLVAEDIDGNNWAIQAKCYDPKYSVTKKDIDSFLSESTNTNIHRRLLIATTDGLGPNARGVINRQHETIPFNRLMLADLLSAPIVWPKSLDQLSTGGVKKAYTPKPYQQIAIDNVTQYLDARGQLIMACGTGKTLTGLWIAEELKSETVLVLLPSLLLLSSTLIEWLTHSKKPFRYLPVCSDEAIGKSDDAIALSTSDLSFSSTTDTDSIAQFLKASGRKVIFSTYQSSPKIAEAFSVADLKPLDLIIADEAHRCTGKVGSAYSTVLDNDQIPAAKRLFMTATPRIFQAHFKKKAADSGVDVVSMDDHVVFGPVLHKLSFGEAIEQDLLTDYQVVVVGIDNPRYSKMIAERSLVQTDNDIQSDAQSFASHIGLAKAMKTYDLKRVISFHSRVSAAKDFANKLPDVIDWMPEDSRPDGELLTGHVSGIMPTNERSRNLRALGEIESDQRYVLSNARCLSEGVDVPALDGVAFIDPRNSEIDIVQAVGRAIRLSKGKAIGSIVIPVFIEDYDDPDEVLNSLPFKKIWAVVNALRSHDEGLGEQLDQLRQALGRRGTVGRPDKITFDLPINITQKFQEALDVKIIESTTASWEFWFGLLCDFYTNHGHCIISRSSKLSNYSDHNKLARWVGKQRNRRQDLISERIGKLDQLNFVWNAIDYFWMERLYELKAYYNECPNKKISKSNRGLAGWVNAQRRNKESLSKDKVFLLENIGFDWDPFETAFVIGFNKFIEFRKEFGFSANISQNLSYKKYLLGKWVSRVRVSFGSNNLSHKDIKELNDYNFIWNQKNQNWEDGFNCFQGYVVEYGSSLVKASFKCPKHQNHEGKDYALGTWVSFQRGPQAKLSELRISRLDELGFVWDVLATQWEARFKQLVTYKEEFGDCLVQATLHYQGYKLGLWVVGQRARKDKLTPEQVNRLDELGFVWDPR